MFDGYNVPAALALPLYKHILGVPFQLSDLEVFDKGVYDSLLYCLDNDVDDLDLDFTVEEERFGESTVVHLKPGGHVSDGVHGVVWDATA